MARHGRQGSSRSIAQGFRSLGPRQTPFDAELAGIHAALSPGSAPAASTIWSSGQTLRAPPRDFPYGPCTWPGHGQTHIRHRLTPPHRPHGRDLMSQGTSWIPKQRQSRCPCGGRSREDLDRVHVNSLPQTAGLRTFQHRQEVEQRPCPPWK